jgi:hypothetical protein
VTQLPIGFSAPSFPGNDAQGRSSDIRREVRNAIPEAAVNELAREIGAVHRQRDVQQPITEEGGRPAPVDSVDCDDGRVGVSFRRVTTYSLRSFDDDWRP